MNAPEKPKRPWWGRKRWRAALAVWLLCPALYVLSSGPSIYAVIRGWIPQSRYDLLYDPPRRWVEGRFPAAVRCRITYLGWWVNLAYKHESATPPLVGERFRDGPLRAKPVGREIRTVPPPPSVP